MIYVSKIKIKKFCITGRGYISPEPMYPDSGDISAPLDADMSISKERQHASLTRGKEVPLLRRRNGELQAGLKDRLQRVVAMKMVIKMENVITISLELELWLFSKHINL